MHPNSLKNLAPVFDTDRAQRAQIASVAKRKANKEAREALKLSMNEWSAYKEELDNDNLSSIDVLKVLMHRALLNEDFDQAADLAKTLAEFETPKLARIESTNVEVSADDLSDEELEAKLAELRNL